MLLIEKKINIQDDQSQKVALQITMWQTEVKTTKRHKYMTSHEMSTIPTYFEDIKEIKR